MRTLRYMPPKRTSVLDRILGRLEDLDTVNLTNLVERLNRERRLMDTIFHTIQDGILVIDSNGIIQYANQAGMRLIGLKDKDLGASVLWRLVPDLARSLDLEALESGEPEERVHSREIEISYPERRFVRLYMVPIAAQFSSTSARGFTVVLSDVSEEKVSTEQMIESERIASIMMLAAGVAHELGNPLNSLKIHLQLIERKLKPLAADLENPSALDKLKRSLDVCSSEVERLDGIIENFLTAIRPAPPDFRDLNLFPLVDEVLQVQEGVLKDLEIEVEVDMPAQLPVIPGDPNQIKQVLFNIIKNGIDAMGQGGRLYLRGRADDRAVYLQIHDSGTGIPQEEVSKIFRPYYTTKKGGHGLGMMIVQRIMRDHAGQIGIDSKPGKGTAVTLQFPRKGPRTRLLES
ncbi:MAG: two-component system sensor histidine kinase NtrB [Verrucomicrobiota bacterium]